MKFEHDYYFPPKKEKESPVVLCMSCGKEVRGPGLTPEMVRQIYKERKILWKIHGKIHQGIVILCPDCVDKDINEVDYPKIRRQIIKGLEDEARWAKNPVSTDLSQAEIVGPEAA